MQRQISWPIFIISIALAALVAGGGVYWWQTPKEEEGDKPPVVVKDCPKDSGQTPTSAPPACPKLLVVTFARPGLLTDTERKNLEVKLINPYVDYAKQGLAALLVTVPMNVGEEYEVDAIYQNGGLHSLLFGKREQTYGYWLPECGPAGTCELTKEFIQKYPQIVVGLEQQGNTVVEAR